MGEKNQKWQRFIFKNNYILRFIIITLCAIIIVLSLIFGVKALLKELSIPNRPIVVPIFELVKQDGYLKEGKPLFGETTYTTVILKNIGRKQAAKIKWRFEFENGIESNDSFKEPFSRSDSIIVVVKNSQNPIEQWDKGVLRYLLEYSDNQGNNFFRNDSVLIQPLISDYDKRKLGGLTPYTIHEEDMDSETTTFSEGK